MKPHNSNIGFTTQDTLIILVACTGPLKEGATNLFISMSEP